MDKPRLAILGASGFGKFHAREFRDAGCDVCAILGSSEESSKKTSEKLWADYGIAANSYYELEKLIGAEHLDAVSICTPPKLHEKQIRTCLEAELHVMCEKPLLLSKERSNYKIAKRLLELADKKKRILTVNTQWPSIIRYLGDFGEKIEKFSMTMEPGLRGGGLITDMIPHMNSMVIRLMPDRRIRNLRFLKLKRDYAKITFDYVIGRDSCDVCYNIRYKKERPREISFSINEKYFKREIGENYEQIIAEDGNRFYVEDPLRVSIKKFVSAFRGEKTLIAKEEILENMKMQDKILKAYLDAVRK